MNKSDLNFRGYKLVTEETENGGGLFSAFRCVGVSCQNSLGYTQYSDQTIATPPTGCGPLTVFCSEETARQFQYRATNPCSSGHKLYTCIYARSKYKKLWVPIKDGGVHTMCVDFPLGTNFADAVLLGEEVTK